MSIQEKPKGSGKWYAIVNVRLADGSRTQVRSEQQPNRTKARADERRMLRERDEDGTLVPSKSTIGSMLERWKTHCRAQIAINKLAPQTVQRYIDIVDSRLIPDLGTIPLDNRHFTSELVESKRDEWVAVGEVSLQTVKHYLVVLGTAAQWACRNGDLRYNPLRLVEKPQPLKREGTILSIEASQALFEVAATTDIYDQAVLFGLLVGVRQGEEIGLRRVDINFHKREFRVRQTVSQLRKHLHPSGRSGAHIRPRAKNDSSQRPRPLSPQAFDVLEVADAIQTAQRAVAGSAWAEHGLVFTKERGEPLNPQTLRRRFRRLLDLAGVPSAIAVDDVVLNVRFHDLRHGVATHQLGQGVDDKDVAANLGHSNAIMVRTIYGHPVPAAQHEAADRFGETLRPSMPASREAGS